MTQTEQRPEFSVVVTLGKLPPEGKSFHLAPDEAERNAVADRLDVVAVDALAGEIHLSATREKITARGKVTAALKRECVASLEEMSEAIDEAFEIEFLRREEAIDEMSDEDKWDAPDVHTAPDFDVGELLVQQLSLAMNPFPRKEGAASLADLYGRAPETSPFAALQGKIEKSE